jgi:hypothetical protein
MSNVASQPRKTTKVGVVTSNAADKSVVVKVENFIMHPCITGSCAPVRSLWRTTRRTPAIRAIGC